MPRLFTGLELPEWAAEAIAFARGGVVGARWVEPADYHITLRFLGDVEAGVARDAYESLGDIRRAAPTIRFAGLSAFGGRKPRAIVELVARDPDLLDLQADHERRLRRIGLPPETRKYVPHVTLARLRGPDPRAVADYLASRGGLTIEPFRPERFALFSARDSVGGGPYVVEAAFPLS
jgi:RNA 2',3'-cyclic 3'-phosphodiesterase